MTVYNNDFFYKEVGFFLMELVPYGSLDIKSCIGALREAKVEYSDFSDYVESFCEDTESSLFKLDICALAYDYILQEARREIEEKVGVDILNDLGSEIWVAGNYCASSYDYRDNQPTIKTIELIASDERSPLLDWFMSQIDG